MIKSRHFATILLLCAALFLSCAKDTPRGALVATSIYPIADIARNVAGGAVTVIHAVPANANPHSYEPDPSTVKQLRDAAVFIGVHPELDGWVGKLLSPGAKKAYLADTIGGENPHLWLSVKKTKLIAAAVRDQLSAAFPDKKEILTANCAAYVKKLDALDARLSALFAGVRNRKFIQWHPAWDYFAADYGLVVAGTIESGHGDSPSLKSFRALADTARREGIKTVLVDQYVQGGTAAALVREIGGIEVRLDSIGDPSAPGKSDYIGLMEHNARVLAGALSGEK
jgi:ABC-type Zn uptake system ZnuABC Zn-binding protein ZnuA